ncbi:MAG: trigger factor [Candidatus Krumholzibacteriia bacterium]
MTESTDRDPTPLAFNATLEAPEPWRRVLRVEVAREPFDQAYARRLQAARKRAVRPGFRPGRVPVAVIEKELRDELRVQTVEAVIERAYREAVTAHELVPVNDPSVTNFSFAEAGQPVTFEIVFEVRPPLTITGYDQLPLKRRATRVADADVDGVVHRLREAQAIAERVERPAETGDEIQLDIVPLGADGQPDETHRVPEYAFTLGEPDNIKAFDEGLAGAAAGDTREVSVAYAADHGNERLRGTTVAYRVAVKEVRRKLLPELNDAFAERVKPGETLLGLRGAIRADLRRQDEEAVRRELEEQLVDALLAANDIPVPPSLTEQYLESGLKDLHTQNERHGRPNGPEEDARYRELTRPLAERIIRTIFLLEAVRRQERLAVTEAEVDARIDEIAHEYGFEPEKYRAYADQGPERERIGRTLEERRAFDFLISRAAISDEPAAEAAGA